MARKIQMQGIGPGGALVTWLSDTPDWAGASAGVSVTDVSLYTRALPGLPPIDPVEVTITSPEMGESPMVGIPFTIAGILNKEGATVDIAGLGAAVVSGFSFELLWTPASAGPVTVSATATDPANGTTDADSVDVTVSTAAVFPSGVTPLARMNGPKSVLYSDAAGTTPTVTGPVRRIGAVAPLTVNWQTPNDATRVRRDGSGIRLEPNPADTGYVLLSSDTGTPLNSNDSTLVTSWVARDGYAGPPYGIALAASPLWGVYGGSDGLSVYVNNTGATLLGSGVARGARIDLVMRYQPTGVKAKILINGVPSGEITIPATIASGSPNVNAFAIGQTQSTAYCTMIEQIIVNQSVSDAKADELLAFVHSIPAPKAFPVHRDLVTITGDSIARGAVSAVPHDCYAFKMLRNLHNAGLPIDMANTAITGTGVSGHAALVAPYYDARRRRNIVIFAAGTNEFASGNDVNYMLPRYYAEADAMRAQGWLVILSTVLDRGGTPGRGLFASGVTKGFYDTNKNAANADIQANWAAHGDALADVGAIPELVATNATYFFPDDEVHVLPAGYSVLEAAYRARVVALLAA